MDYVMCTVSILPSQNYFQLLGYPAADSNGLSFSNPRLLHQFSQKVCHILVFPET